MIKKPLWLKVTIISFIIMLAFRLFNEPYFFGKTLSASLSLISQLISAGVILSIIFGLYYQKLWAYWLFIADIAFGFINHIFVIIIYLTKPEIVDSYFIGKNPLLNNILFILYPILAVYWLFLGYLVYKNKRFFKQKGI